MHAHPRSTTRILAAALLTACLALAAGACVPKKPAPDTPAVAQEPVARQVVNPDALDVDTAYAKALEAFWRADYKTAAALFESVARKMDDQSFRAKALYGLACARLAGAADAQELKAAQEAWLEWEKTAVGQEGQADPRMMTPFVRGTRMTPPVREPKPGGAPAQGTGQNQSQAQAQAPAHVRANSAQDQDLARRLQEKEKEVLHLQKQIKALEAIHREIQEKKKMSAQ